MTYTDTVILVAIGCLLTGAACFMVGVFVGLGMGNDSNHKLFFIRKKCRSLASHLWQLWGERDEALENIDRLVGMATRYHSRNIRYGAVISDIEESLDTLDDLRGRRARGESEQ